MHSAIANFQHVKGCKQRPAFAATTQTSKHNCCAQFRQRAQLEPQNYGHLMARVACALPRGSKICLLTLSRVTSCCLCPGCKPEYILTRSPALITTGVLAFIAVLGAAAAVCVAGWLSASPWPTAEADMTAKPTEAGRSGLGGEPSCICVSLGCCA